MKRLYILASVTLVFSASSVAAELTAEVPKGDPEFIAKAMSAAPADIGKNATIIRIGDGFKRPPSRPERTDGLAPSIPTASRGVPMPPGLNGSGRFRPRPSRLTRPASST